MDLSDVRHILTTLRSEHTRFTVEQAIVFLGVCMHPGEALVDIAGKAGTSKGTVSRQVIKLKGMGLVTTHEIENDTRYKRAALTTKGAWLRDQLTSNVPE